MSEAVTPLVHDGKNYVRAEAPRGKKAGQVAHMIKELQDSTGVPIEFEALCLSAGQKYPQDVQAAVLALEMVEDVDRYQLASDVGARSKIFYVWVGRTDPTQGSAAS